jgi:eukaryotic-like serine/threonine-protein kinase
MALSAGQRIGGFEIISAVGHGAMGIVYRGRDLRLNREVAIKVLRVAQADDTALMRARREGQILASLNHPHIAQIYGVEELEGAPVLIMEYVDGSTLADRIARGQVPWRIALTLARQVAVALEAAHDRGIVHRDLKPANIKVTADGTVKVLDFGIAQVASPSAVSPDMTASPTLSVAETSERGVIVGTPAYMSPEQAVGGMIDRRADVWAFGAVVFELLCGKRAFSGATLSELMAQVTMSEPDWTALPAELPETITRLLRRCLHKDARQRLGDLSVARLDIDDVLAGRALAPRSSAARPRLAWIVAGIALAGAVAIALALSGVGPDGESASEMRVQVAVPTSTTSFHQFALSPDGTRVAYVRDGAVWLHTLSSNTSRELSAGGADAAPIWSPAGDSIAFFTRRELKRFDIDSGLVRSLAPVSDSLGASWGAAGDLVYVPAHASPIRRLPAGGGEPQDITVIAPGEVGHRFPAFLPDGKHFVYLAMGPVGVRGVYLGALGSREHHRLFPSDAPAVPLAPDWLLFARDGALVGQRIDVSRGVMTGEVVPIAERVGIRFAAYSGIALSSSMTGQIAYRADSGLRQIAFNDRTGRRLRAVGEPSETLPYNAAVSPNDRELVLEIPVAGNLDLWAVDLERGSKRRLTRDRSRDGAVAWAPDGRTLVYSSERSGVLQLYSLAADGSAEHALAAAERPRVVIDWSPDPDRVLFFEQGFESGRRYFLAPLSGGAAVPVETDAGETLLGYSPDGKWMAYVSAESGRNELYLRPFQQRAGGVQVSTAGAARVLWRADGRELYFTEDGRVMAVAVGGASEPVLSPPTQLFDLGARRLLDVTSDGTGFVTLDEAQPAPPISLILNWAPSSR